MSAGRQDDALNQPTEELPSLHEDGPGHRLRRQLGPGMVQSGQLLRRLVQRVIRTTSAHAQTLCSRDRPDTEAVFSWRLA